jgi:GAF domain-containing protein
LFRKFDEFTALSELTRAITPIQNYPLLLRSILDESAGLLKAEQGSLMLIDQETEDLLLSAKKGTVEGLADQTRIHRGEGIAGRVAQFGEALLVEDLEQDRRIRQKNRLHYKTRSFVSIPIKIGDRVIGVLNLSDKTTGEVFNEEDLKLIQAFATHAAIVMDGMCFERRGRKTDRHGPSDRTRQPRYLFERLKKINPF